MDETLKAKLIFVRDEVFGPNSTMYECMTDEELFADYEEWGGKGDIRNPWWQDHYKTKNKLFAWGKFQLEMEFEWWVRENVDSKDFLKDITKRWNQFVKLEKKYSTE